MVSNATGANLTSGIAPISLGASARPRRARGRRAGPPRVVDPLGAELLVLGNLSRDQLDRYGEVHAVGDLWRHTAETHPDLRVVANASDPHVVWAATPAKPRGWTSGWAGGTTPPPARTAPPAQLELGSVRLLVVRLRAAGDAEPARRRHARARRTRVPLRLAAAGRWNLANAALAVTAATTHFGVDPHDAADAATTITTVAGRYMTVALPDGRRAGVLLAKNPAGWSEVLHHLSDRNCSVVIAVNMRVADGKDRRGCGTFPTSCCGQPVAAAGERLRRGGATALRRGRPHRRARPLAAAAKLPGDDVNIVVVPAQFSTIYRRFG